MEARKYNASLQYQWISYKSEGTHPTLYAEQSNAIEAVNDRELNNNYPTDNPVAQNNS